jgi:hypothetical protein
MAPTESENFRWDRFDDEAYRLDEDGAMVIWNGNLEKSHFPVIGNKGFAEGKHFWRVHCQSDSFRVGMCTANVPLDKPIGTTVESWFVDLTTGDVWNGVSDCGSRSIYVPAPNAIARLHKMCCPSTGGIVGLKLDVEEGTLKLFFNDEYMGVMVRDADLKRKGPFFPCVGITGLEGKFAKAIINGKPVPPIYSYKRNKL